MKTTNPSRASRASLALSASLLLAATAASGTTFSFYFNNGTGLTRTSALHQWTTSVGTSGTLVSTVGVNPFPGSGVSNGNAVAAIAGQSSLTGFCYYLPDVSVAPGATPGVLMLYGNNTNTDDVFQPNQTNQDRWLRVGTENLLGLTVGAISQLSVYTRPATTATVMRFAIKVDGAWYASETSFTQTNDVFEQRVVNPNAINWISGVGVTGTSLDDDLSDNPSAPLPASGVVTNYGWYADTGAQSGTNARVRIDSYQITTATDAYTSWAGGTFANPFPEGQRGAELDYDNDGLRNLIEFVLGGDPTLSQAGVSPSVVTASGVDLVITFNRSDESELQPVAVKVQVSNDLVTWNPADDIAIGNVSNAGPIGGTGASYTVAENGAAPDTIVVTIPKGAVTKKFARVVATQ